jgi:4-oxalocrotonate tautomerase
MPYLHLRVSAAESSDTTESLANCLMTHTRDILGKQPELTSIDIEYTRPRHWYVAGVPVNDIQSVTFNLDIKITEGTNTKSQKASYIQKVFSDIQDILGPVSEASYIVIHDLRADAWGYSGRTQEARFIENQSL